MNRRGFGLNVAGAALAAMVPGFVPPLAARPAPATAAGADPAFQFSVMLWTVFTDLPFEQRLEKVAEAGYRNVELVGEFSKWSDADYLRINARRKELGMTFDTTAGLKHGLGDPGDRPALLAATSEMLMVMEKLECPSLILMAGNVVAGMSHETQHQSCIDGLAAAAKLVEGKKIAGRPVQLLLETIDPEENPKYLLTSAAEAIEIVKAVNHPQVKFLYDFFHEQIAEGNLIEKLEKNIEHITLVHIADVPGRHEPGTGEINYQSIFRKLGDLKYKGMVAMEFHPTGDAVAQLRAARELAIRSSADH